MENTRGHFNNVVSIFFNLNAAETTDELQQLVEKILPQLSEFGSWTLQNKFLNLRYNKIQHYGKLQN